VRAEISDPRWLKVTVLLTLAYFLHVTTLYFVVKWVGRAGAILGPSVGGFLFRAGYSLEFVAIVMGSGSFVAAGAYVLPNRKEAPVPFGLISQHYFDIFGNMKVIDAIESLAALAQESRLSIFRMLVKRGPEGYTPTQLGEKLNVSSPTLSFHLKELQRAGLVDMRREGRFLYYRPNFTHMNQLIGFLTENCCVLADRGCGPECVPGEAEAPHTKRQRA
jgi:DNA-binding transcriptional ArsR family regulator